MILNQTANCIISKQEVCYKSFFTQARGLMFRKKQSLILQFNRERKVSLHMFFVFYQIDVFLINENKEVVEIKRNFRPFTVYYPKHKAKYIIETPELNQEVKLGDKITIK